MKEKNILQILRNSRHTVVLSGAGLMAESGYPLLRDGEESYEIEEKYGYSFEEIFSSGFYAGEGFYALKSLQDRGLIGPIITRRIAGLEDRAGCRDVINLKGTVFRNRCPNCGREYPVEYIKEARGVPLCESCMTALRPDVCLLADDPVFYGIEPDPCK